MVFSVVRLGTKGLSRVQISSSLYLAPSSVLASGVSLSLSLLLSLLVYLFKFPTHHRHACDTVTEKYLAQHGVQSPSDGVNHV